MLLTPLAAARWRQMFAGDNRELGKAFSIKIFRYHWLPAAAGWVRSSHHSPQTLFEWPAPIKAPIKYTFAPAIKKIPPDLKSAMFAASNTLIKSCLFFHVSGTLVRMFLVKMWRHATSHRSFSCAFHSIFRPFACQNGTCELAKCTWNYQHMAVIPICNVRMKLTFIHDCNNS